MIYESPYNDGFAIPDCDITTLLLDHNLKGCKPTKAAIIDGENGRVAYTYQSLREGVIRVAGFLQKELGIRRGDVVGYLSFNTLYYPVLVHAVLATGAILSAFNPIYTPGELAHTLSLARPKHILVQSDLLGNLEAAIARLAQETDKFSIHVLDGLSNNHPSYEVKEILRQSRYSTFFTRVSRTPEQTANDLAFICFSSGTSALMKGVRLTHRNVVANVAQQGHCLSDMFTPTTVFTLVVPFFHILGLGGFCVQFLCHGAPVVVFKSFDLPKMLASISRDRVTHVNVVPPIALALLQSPLTKTADFSSVRCLMNAAAPLKQNLADELCSRVGCVLTQWYGMTEASPSVISQRESDAHVKGTIGKLLPRMEMKVIGEDGKELGHNQPGELCLKGPNIMQGYVDQLHQGMTATEDEFFHTGDVGYVDEEGFVFIVDRLKELIKVKGQQVAPAELEAILLSHPCVIDAAVCGVHVEDEATEYPIAYIVVGADTLESRDQISEDVEKFVDGQVAHYKRLAGGVHVLEAIPKNPSGKILRRLLPARLDKAGTEALVAERRRKRLRSRI